MRTPTNAADRLAARYIPKDARCVLEHTNGSACWVYDRGGKFYAIAFWGTSAKSLWHHSFRTEQQRDAYVWQFRESVEASVTRKQADRQQKAAWVNPLTVGQILYTSWGYDQTNVEFYVVTRVSGRRVWIRQIASDYEATGFMSGNTWAAMPIRMTGEETMHIAQPSGANGVYVKINESAYAWPENGRTHNTTSYA